MGSEENAVDLPRDVKTGRLKPGRRKPTKKQRNFITLLAEGVRPTTAAREAGYVVPNVEAARLRRQPAIRAAIREVRELRFEQLAALGQRRLREMITNRETPPGVLLQAIMHVNAMAGHDGKQRERAAGVAQDVRELSLAELEALWRQRIENTKETGSSSTADPTLIAPDGAVTIDQAIEIIEPALAMVASAPAEEAPGELADPLDVLPPPA